VVSELRELGIESLYHLQYGELQGDESMRTFYMNRNKLKSFHIDYVFASINFIRKGYLMEIGILSNWIHLSDHVPLVVDFN
jgi:endonuclease/exonuclease/phosphatase family metal-dependent hydrolase